MHGQDLAEREYVVEDGEDRLPHFAGVTGPTDDHQAPLEVDEDEGFGPRSIQFRIGVELRDVDDGEAGHVFLCLVPVGPHEGLACD